MGHSLNRTSFRISQNLIIDDNTFNPGYILVSDANGNASWKNPSGYINQTEPLDHFIGELYGGGVVVAVWREVKEAIYEKCLIASVKDYGEPHSVGSVTDFTWIWGSGASVGSSAQYSSFGASNSAAIVAADPGAPAATVCLGYINEDLGGLGVYGDWYLPSIYELNCLANNSAIVNRVIAQYASDKSIRLYDQGSSGSVQTASMSLFCGAVSGARSSGKGYWTSNEGDSMGAVYLQMDTLKFDYAFKSAALNVRPFRLDVKRWNGVSWVQDRNRTGKILVTHNGAVVEGKGPTIVANLTSIEQSLSNTVTYATYSNILSADLSIYDHIWDIGVETQYTGLSGTITTVLGSNAVTGVSTLFLTQLSVGDTIIVSSYYTYTVASISSNTSMTITTSAASSVSTSVSKENNDKLTRIMGAKYKTYLQNGGGLFILGENASFPVRNKDIAKFLTELGGGSVETPSTASSDTQTVASEFLLANNSSTISFGAGGLFGALGNGTSICSLLFGGSTAAVWKTGSLSVVPKGAVVSVLDINFLSSNFTSSSQLFAANVSQILNKS